MKESIIPLPLRHFEVFERHSLTYLGAFRTQPKQPAWLTL